MVKLTEVEDEHFSEKPSTTGDGALFEDDDDYTDTDSSLSDDEDFPKGSSASLYPDETLSDRIYALRDMIPPSTRTKISSTLSTLSSASAKTVHYGGRGLWALCTTILLFGMPYALAMGSEQEMLEEERQRALMNEGANAMLGGDEGKASL